MAIAIAWGLELLAVATRHPVIATAGLMLALLSLILSRSIILFVAAIFLAIAAVYGTEPVDDPLKRHVFAYGCFATILLVSLVAMTLRLRLRDTRDRLRHAEASEAELRRLYDDEVRWRQAGGDSRDSLEPAGTDRPGA
ncbi:hypothetical protein VQ042_16120 [Aurantimonas sp. A2-1-M11]|uniref:hypothetical protein n=1 Tax=Aurantimonas sp. A2-1-M11 TaxID=3113712 RepID=UPI002F9202BB